MAEKTQPELPGVISHMADFVLSEGMKKHVTDATKMLEALGQVRKIVALAPSVGYSPLLAADAHRHAADLVNALIDLTVSYARKDADRGMEPAINFIETAKKAKRKLQEQYEKEEAEILEIKNEMARQGSNNG